MRSALSRFKGIRLDARIVPAALLVLSLVSFGLLIPRLGLYWDDWPGFWFLHFYGPSIFPEVWALDRPLLGWLFVLTTQMIGESILAWQLFGVLARCLSGLALWWTLRTLWPQRIRQVTSIALLFIVYPGFGQQYISFTYSHHFLVLTLTLLSLNTMLLACRRPGWFWPLTIFSLLSSATSMFMMEYFVGLELLRPAFLWLVQDENEVDTRERIQRVGVRWLPYWIPLFFFLAWRFLNSTPRAEIDIFDRLRTNPVSTVLELLGTVVSDGVNTGLVAWGKVLDFSLLSNFGADVFVRFIVIILGIYALTTFLLSRLHGRTESQLDDISVPRRRWAFQAILLGAYALAVGGIPVWMTDLHIGLIFPWDRFTLPMMLGACVLFVGLLELLVRTPLQSAVIVGLVVGLAAGFHYQNALKYRQEWLMQRDFFWQLTWRAPGIQPRTVLLTSELPFAYTSDNSLTAPLNWTYAPQKAGPDLSYLFYDLESRLGTSMESLGEDQPIQEPYRAVHFEGSTDQALLVAYQPPYCLKVIDPSTDQRIPDKPRHFREALPLSNPGLILLETDIPAQPPMQFFGPEPEHDWCYHFQNAELARQKGDWGQVVAIGEQAKVTNQTATEKSVVELAPFIEGYARAGVWKKAARLTNASYRAQEYNALLLCDLWERIRQTASLDEQGQQALESVRTVLQCPAP